MSFLTEKEITLKHFDEMESTPASQILEVMKRNCSESYNFKGVYPFLEIKSLEEVASKVWIPLKNSLSSIQRRQDIFIGGNNEIDGSKWTMSMGHFMGLFDKDWLGIPHTRKMISLRYAEFNCIEDNKISRTGLFLDIIGFMKQANVDPLPPETGHYFVYPGPRRHNGLLFSDADPSEGVETLALINKMIQDLDVLNKSGSMGCPPEVLEKSWSDRMIWYGPAGIGASYTIPRYQEQHQLPFRNNLKDKTFNGHVCRFAEGNFACFFGWPNLTNTPIGGFLGLPGGQIRADMQVVDVYSRYEDKLEENWVLIDIPYWLKQQGLDILSRTNSIFNSTTDGGSNE